VDETAPTLGVESTTTGSYACDTRAIRTRTRGSCSGFHANRLHRTD